MTREPAHAPPCAFVAPEALPRAYGPSPARGRIKCEAQDFQVEEILGFEPEGEGPHAWLLIRKRDTNTTWLAAALARLAEVRPRDVGYAGLKDRRAVTTQWFSVPLEGRSEPDWTALDSEQLQIVRVTRHRKKLRRGIQSGNRFRIRVRDLQGDAGALQARARALTAGGVPNYFGEQRFGRDGANVAAAWEMLSGARRVRDRQLRGLYLSTVRAMLFNRVLASRVEDGSWRRALAGEVLMLDGSHSVFTVDTTDRALEQRLAELDVHPTGPLWGSGEGLVRDQALSVETAVLGSSGPWCRALEAAGLRHARRALRVAVPELVLSTESEGTVVLDFVLPAGAYATMALRELVDSAQV